jgi:uncharacterized protein YkwD
MFRFLSFLLLFILLSTKLFPQNGNPGKQLPEICISQTEKELYKLINEYRAKKGLPQIKLSSSLCFVAQTHAKDQSENYKERKNCNLHSWSNKGNWTPGCYTPDHKNAKIMWAKPRELTNYQGDGFEISFFSTYSYTSTNDHADDILAGWKKSPGHNDVILNKNIWKQLDWQAIGIGICGNYANVWFGAEEDTAGEPKSGNE